METWYRTGGFGRDLIESVTVVKSTDKTVVVRQKDWHGHETDSRAAIKSGYKNYFRTWKEAHAYLLARAEAAVESARRRLELANGQLGNVRGLKKTA